MNRLSHLNGKIDVWYFPKGIFPSGNLARVFSKVATFQQIPNLKLPKSLPPTCSRRCARPLAHPSDSTQPSLQPSAP